MRNKVLHFIYKKVCKPVFFLFDPEFVHDRFIIFGRILGKYSYTRKAVSLLFSYADSSLVQSVCGITFKNPVGLSAGFDKNAVLTNIVSSVGFGFIEVGSVTGEPCNGNPTPRLWRLKKSQALVVHYGLKNDGAEKIAERLKQKPHVIPIGVNVAKTNSPTTVNLDAGIRDYVKAYKEFVSIADYFTINISCPNAFGGQPFTDPAKLDALLTHIDDIDSNKPNFIKLSPDLTHEELDAIIDVAKKHRIQGFVCANLTKKRDNPNIQEKTLPEKGGISGKVVQDMSDSLIKYIFQKTNGTFVIIGVGGIFSAADAYKKIRNGASLVELISGMIFEGPQLISEINRGLVELLKKDGFLSITDAIGTDAK